MTRAEEAALEAYPDYPTMDGGYVTQRKTRKVFKQGYEAAEKDLVLTWEDMELLHRLFAEEEDNFSKHDKYFYTEVLTRFKQFKKGKK